MEAREEVEKRLNKLFVERFERVKIELLLDIREQLEEINKSILSRV